MESSIRLALSSSASTVMFRQFITNAANEETASEVFDNAVAIYLSVFDAIRDISCVAPRNAFTRELKDSVA